jgi:DNA-binding CsgD family transcriptional regulator
MFNKASENTKTQRALNSQNTDVPEILCQFHVDNNDFTVLLAEDPDTPEKSPVLDGNSLTEICRFNVNGYNCLIMKKAPTQERDESNLSVVLSARELQIATLVALGCPNKQVADKLHISEWTVATYLRRIYAKLGVDTRAAMTYRCASLICKQDAVLTR